MRQERKRRVPANNRAKTSLKGAGKEAFFEAQRRWWCLFRPRKPLRTAGRGSRSVGQGATRREEFHIQTISCTLLCPVV